MSADRASGAAAEWLARARSARIEGRLTDAIEACRRALDLAPEDGQAWNELAHALRWHGEPENALRAATRATETAPGLAGGWFNLGAALEDMQQLERAGEAYRTALQIEPDHAEAWSNLGGLLGVQGRQEDAIAAYRSAVRVDPQLAPAWSNLGNALRAAGRLDEAVTACRRACELAPAFAAAWSNLGSTLHDCGRYEEAIAAARQALRIDPELAHAWDGLGSCLRSVFRYAEAIDAHRRAIRAGVASFHFNFGMTLQHCGRLREAIAQLRRALEIDPMDADAHCELSLALLSGGQLAEGWEEYEWRWRRAGAPSRRYPGARWSGERSGRLLLWSEQGIGDQILYASMMPDLDSTALRVTLEVDPRLVALFQRSFPRALVMARRDPGSIAPASYDYQAPLADLGRWLRPALDAFPRRAGYLMADAQRMASFSARLGVSQPAPRVGISWASANREFGERKTAPLEQWAGILKVPGVQFVDLQYGDTAPSRSVLRSSHGVEMVHFEDLDLFYDLDGLAALCAACDLVITASNVTAHMAGALGRPTWLLVPQARGRLWYWFAGRDDSPWYPSMRIHAQRALGDWTETLQVVAAELGRLAEQQRSIKT